MRRFGNPPISGVRYTPRPGAYVILRRDDQILLTCQMGPNPEFQLPGGGIDPGESPIQAAQRETLEETGWRIANLRRIGGFRLFIHMPEYELMAEKICHVFVARPVMQISPPLEDNHYAIWASLPRAAQLAGNPGDAHFLNALVRAQGGG